jgi:hypothetical protein
MTIPRLLRWAGLACVAAAVLMITSDLVGMPLDTSNPAAAVASPAYSAFTILKLVGAVLLLPGLVGLYLGQSVPAGRLGLVGFLVALTGTALVVGDWWFETFVIPWQLGVAPELATATAGGILLVGGSVSFALLSLGWILFGLATFRAGTFPRWSAVLLMIGGALAYRVGFPPFGLGLAVAVGVLGLLSYRLDGPPQATGQAGVVAREHVVVDLDHAATAPPPPVRPRRD